MYMPGPVNATDKGATRSKNAAQQTLVFPYSTSHRQIVQEVKTEYKPYGKSAGFKPTINSVVD